jgi:hypothetical protein
VPSLARARRLSKVLIVNEAERHLRQRRALCVAAAADVRALLRENGRLAAELNAARRRHPRPDAPVDPLPVTDALAQLMDIEAEAAGEFPAGFGDNWAGRRLKASPSSPASPPSLNVPPLGRDTRPEARPSATGLSGEAEFTWATGQQAGLQPSWGLSAGLHDQNPASLAACPDLFSLAATGSGADVSLPLLDPVAETIDPTSMAFFPDAYSTGYDFLQQQPDLQLDHLSQQLGSIDQ